MSQNCSKIISMAYLWICGAKSRSTPVSPTTVPDLLLSIRAVMWSFSPKHSNDSPSESDEHCDDFVDGSMKMITREISDKNVCFYIFVYKTIFSSRPPKQIDTFEYISTAARKSTDWKWVFNWPEKKYISPLGFVQLATIGHHQICSCTVVEKIPPFRIDVQIIIIIIVTFIIFRIYSHFSHHDIVSISYFDCAFRKLEI